MDSLIESIKAWIKTCDIIVGERVMGVDYLGVEQSYSIEPLTSDPIVRRYTDGSSVRQFQFAFTSRELYDNSDANNATNNEFYENLSDWVDSQNKLNNLPTLTDADKTALSVEVMSNGYLFDSEADTARYQIQLRLLYKKEY